MRGVNYFRRLPFVDGQPSVILKKIGELEPGDGQDVRFQQTAN
jgi:hypothetical protein